MVFVYVLRDFFCLFLDPKIRIWSPDFLSVKVREWKWGMNCVWGNYVYQWMCGCLLYKINFGIFQLFLFLWSLSFLFLPPSPTPDLLCFPLYCYLVLFPFSRSQLERFSPVLNSYLTPYMILINISQQTRQGLKPSRPTNIFLNSNPIGLNYH